MTGTIVKRSKQSGQLYGNTAEMTGTIVKRFKRLGQLYGNTAGVTGRTINIETLLGSVGKWIKDPNDWYNYMETLLGSL